jgi:glutamine synthetase
MPLPAGFSARRLDVPVSPVKEGATMSERARVEQLIQEREIDTVKIGGADYDGIFRGKRLPADVFLDGLEYGFAQGDVLFGWDIGEELVPGLRYTNWDTGYADLRMLPDLATFRVVPWEAHSASVICDFISESGAAVAVSPRQVLRRVLERAASRGYRAELALEYEFRIWREDARSLREKRWRKLTALSPTTSCYNLARSTGDEFIVGRLRREMDAHGVPIEGYNREHGEGMYEMNLRHAPGLEAADRALLFRSGVKEICTLEGLTASFMAKPFDDQDGNSGHLHQSLWSGDGHNVFYDAGRDHGLSATFRAYIAGVLRLLPEALALYAPNVNSYKRFVTGSWAPTVAAWGLETRTPSLRVITGSAKSTHLENRVPGSDVNPYLAMAASLACGLYGIEHGLELPPPVSRNAYDLPEEVAPRLPRSLDESIERFAASAFCREAFGEEFVADYATMRRWEAQRFRAVVTEWERNRYLDAL